MIYLIGGPPRSGKTILAKKMCSELKISFFSVDSLEVALTKNKINKNDFPKTYLKNKKSFDEIFEENSIKNIIKDYRNQGKHMEKFIERIIDREIWEGNDFIFEGYQITPSFAIKMRKKFGRKNIKTIFIVQTNKQLFLQNQRKSPKHNNWIIQGTTKKETQEKIAEMLCDYGKIFKKEAIKNNFKIKEMNKNFDKNIDKIINYFKKVTN